MGHFNSPFTEHCSPLRYSTVSLSSIPSFLFYQEPVETKGGGGKKDEVWGVYGILLLYGKKPSHYRTITNHVGPL